MPPAGGLPFCAEAPYPPPVDVTVENPLPEIYEEVPCPPTEPNPEPPDPPAPGETVITVPATKLNGVSAAEFPPEVSLLKEFLYPPAPPPPA